MFDAGLALRRAYMAKLVTGLFKLEAAQSAPLTVWLKTVIRAKT
jgi:hypothetical protein